MPEEKSRNRHGCCFVQIAQHKSWLCLFGFLFCSYFDGRCPSVRECEWEWHDPQAVGLWKDPDGKKSRNTEKVSPPFGKRKLLTGKCNPTNTALNTSLCVFATKLHHLTNTFTGVGYENVCVRVARTSFLWSLCGFNEWNVTVTVRASVAIFVGLLRPLKSRRVTRGHFEQTEFLKTPILTDFRANIIRLFSEAIQNWMKKNWPRFVILHCSTWMS